MAANLSIRNSHLKSSFVLSMSYFLYSDVLTSGALLTLGRLSLPGLANS